MAFDFPATPADGETYTSGNATYQFETADGVWRKQVAAPSTYVRLVGDTMTGTLKLPSPAPTQPVDATHKAYVDEAIASSALYQGPWQVAANVPDLDPAVANPQHTFSWIAQTADVNVPETALASLPGIGGQLIFASDNIVWNENTSVYDIIRAPASMAGYLPLVGGTLTGRLNITQGSAATVLAVTTADGKPTLTMNPSSGTHSGLIEFWDPANGTTRRGYIGYGTATNLNLAAENGKWNVKGGFLMEEGAGIHWGNTSAQTDPLVMNEGICLYGWGGTSKFGFSITSGTLNYVVENTANLHCFRVGAASKVTISNANGLWTENGVPAKFHGPVSFEAGSHLMMDQTGIYSQNATFNNVAMQFFRYGTSDRCQVRGYGTSEGGLRYHCYNGGYGWSDNWRSDVVPSGGLYVGGQMSAGSIVDRGTAATKRDIRETTAEETTAAFAALKPKRFVKIIADPVDVDGKPLPKEQCWPPDKRLRWGFVVDDIVANPATKDIAGFSVIPGTNGQQEPIGTDVMQVLALAVAKIKLLEVEIAALKGGPAPTPAAAKPTSPAPATPVRKPPPIRRR